MRWPDERGWFGEFGGRFVPETLVPACEELEREWRRSAGDADFQAELSTCLREYVGRPTPLTPARRLGDALGGRALYLKREDLNHTGSHKINNTVGQALLARRMGKKRIIAETGAGQHGVATATVCALLGLECVVYMGQEDARRQALNLFRMRLLGARVVAVESGTRTLKDATSEAIRDWVTNVESTHYIIGSVVGPHPYPAMVRDFQRVIGVETRRQILAAEGALPALVAACVGGGSNAIGIFSAFVDDAKTRLVGVEAAGEGLDTTRHAASIGRGAAGVLHGSRSLLIQDQEGQVAPVHSISAGLDYPGVGPEHAALAACGRARYEAVSDSEALAAFRRVGELEGILPALETAHAFAWLFRARDELPEDGPIVVNVSGRGDKDVAEIEKLLEEGEDAS